jgi:hypothetical protein
MAKITDQDRALYQEKVKIYVSMTKSLLDTEKKLLVEARKNTPNSSIQKLVLADEMLNLASYYIVINGMSQTVLRNKNEEALNDARKSLYKSVIYLEEVVSNLIDAPFSDYEDKLSMIESYNQDQRYQLICKMGFAIDLLEQAYGDNSKWRWTFVDLEGRFAVTAKNILDLKSIYDNMSPGAEYYDSTVYHLRLVKKLISQAADRYREKYELSTGQVLDFKTGINFLGALRRLHIVLSENEESNEVKKKLAIWSAKLETDHKKQEEAKKRA